MNVTDVPLTAVTFTTCVNTLVPNMFVQPPPSIVGAFCGALIHMIRPAVRPDGVPESTSVVDPRVVPLFTFTVVNCAVLPKSQLVVNMLTWFEALLKRSVVAGFPLASTCPRSVLRAVVKLMSPPTVKTPAASSTYWSAPADNNAALICATVAVVAILPVPSPPLATLTLKRVRVVGSTSSTPTMPFHVPPKGKRATGTASAMISSTG